jgi:type VI secretion system protein ImpH
VTLRQRILNAPEAHDFFAVLRSLEATHADRPRIGDSATVREEYVALGQDPWFPFPEANLSKAETDPSGRLRILTKFLGLLGPQGALPLAITDEAHAYFLANDHAFARFLDLFNNRFQQLFFRAWADSRAIAQADRPALDRFGDYVGSQVGVGSAIYLGHDLVPDGLKRYFAGLAGAQAKSASRLRSLVAGVFRCSVQIEEFVGSRLTLDPGDVSRMGVRNARLGSDLMLGASLYTVVDKFRIVITTRDMAEYRGFLPSDRKSEALADLIFFYLGEELDWDVELAIPCGKVEPVRLGKSGQLGWTSWIAPNWTVDPGSLRRDARFSPQERLREKRRRQAEDARREAETQARRARSGKRRAEKPTQQPGTVGQT